MTIFDLVGLARRVSQHPDHSATASYCGAIDAWELYVHNRTDQCILYNAKITDEPYMVSERTLEQAYKELKEYLP
jgi:hypothetical protein